MSAATEAVLSSSAAADALLKAARRCLAQSPYRELRSISCEHDRGRLVLRGAVRCYYQKQLAQEALANLGGLADVCNDIEVRPRRVAASAEPSGSAPLSGG